MKKPLKQITVKITEDKEKQLKKYANKYHDGNMAKALREFIDKGLSINSYSEEITFLREMINKELRIILDPYMNRLLAVSSKGGIMSASSFYAMCDVLSKLVEPGERRRLEEILTENKKRGYVYIRSKDYKVEEMAEEEMVDK